ncbi:PadR family transcriptional regulator [Bacillus salacetis]|uniref:PadR family transcriptional regulator n=1 Tax=Bacillus salacetis TaxID=2315464 RepID=A0A3A1QQB6_9BACI|nr:PadR family transcriptional regulator [Bacillus salacetis]RIW29044.1 PadR family transcriptional regulator [Bacillus salacetis]
MDNRLKNLKKTMKTTTFSGLEFNEAHRKEIHNRIKDEENEDQILLAILQLLTFEKNGFELAKQLRSRGIKKFEDQEGMLYTILHRMEGKEYLEAHWTKGNGKVYKLSRKGSRLLKKQEKRSAESRAVLKTLMEVRSNG